MPKIVDHEARRRQLAQVVWGLIAREGLDAVSVRAVARAAGLSHGSVQYYFANHKELLTFAMDVIVDVSARRLDAIERGDAAETLLASLESLAPLDPDAAIATRLWVEMFTRSLTDPDFQRVNLSFNQLLADTIAQQLNNLAEQCGFPDPEAVGDETVRLHAMFDGACVHAVIDPERMPPARLRALLRRHVTELAERWRRG